MPGATSNDAIEDMLKKSLKKNKHGDLDQNIASSAQRLLQQTIDFVPAKEASSFQLSSLKSKYKVLKPRQQDEKQASSGSCPPSPAILQKTHSMGKKGVVVSGDSNGGAKLGESLPTPRVVIYPPEEVQMGWRTKLKVGGGLMNLGNTCFLNATLQCLTYTPPLVNYCQSDHHVRTCRQGASCVMCSMRQHIKTALHHNGSAFRPQAILRKLKDIAKHFRYGRQEDAHEFLRLLMDRMQKACMDGHRKLDKWSKETTVIHQIFGGFLRSQVQCLKCSARSNTYEPFMDLSLNLKQVTTLEEALAKFVKPETLDSSNAYDCQRCGQKTPAKKRFSVHKLPNILTVQLNRFGFTRAAGKITKHIQFPEKLNMRPYMSHRQGEAEYYHLYAVLVHSGHHCSMGHYFSYVRAPSNVWYIMNDSSVHQVSASRVFGSQAYLLFYSKAVPSLSLSIPKAPLIAPSAVPNGVVSPQVNGAFSKSAAKTFSLSTKGVGDVGVPVSRQMVSPTKLLHSPFSKDRAGAATPGKPEFAGKSAGLPATDSRPSLVKQSDSFTASGSKTGSGQGIVMEVKNGKMVTTHTSQDSSMQASVDKTPSVVHKGPSEGSRDVADEKECAETVNFKDRDKENRKRKKKKKKKKEMALLESSLSGVDVSERKGDEKDGDRSHGQKCYASKDDGSQSHKREENSTPKLKKKSSKTSVFDGSDASAFSTPKSEKSYSENHVPDVAETNFPFKLKKEGSKNSTFILNDWNSTPNKKKEKSNEKDVSNTAERNFVVKLKKEKSSSKSYASDDTADLNSTPKLKKDHSSIGDKMFTKLKKVNNVTEASDTSAPNSTPKLKKEKSCAENKTPDIGDADSPPVLRRFNSSIMNDDTLSPKLKKRLSSSTFDENPPPKLRRYNSSDVGAEDSSVKLKKRHSSVMNKVWVTVPSLMRVNSSPTGQNVWSVNALDSPLSPSLSSCSSAHSVPSTCGHWTVNTGNESSHTKHNSHSTTDTKHNSHSETNNRHNSNSPQHMMNGKRPLLARSESFDQVKKRKLSSPLTPDGSVHNGSGHTGSCERTKDDARQDYQGARTEHVSKHTSESGLTSPLVFTPKCKSESYHTTVNGAKVVENGDSDSLNDSSSAHTPRSKKKHKKKKKSHKQKSEEEQQESKKSPSANQQFYSPPLSMQNSGHEGPISCQDGTHTGDSSSKQKKSRHVDLDITGGNDASAEKNVTQGEGKKTGKESSKGTPQDQGKEAELSSKASVPVQSWDHYVKDRLGLKKSQSVPSSPHAASLLWDGNKKSQVVQELFKKPEVSTWSGEKSEAELEAEREEKRRQKKTWKDRYEEELDKGKVKKVKKRTEDVPWAFNPFQKYQNQKNQQKYNFDEDFGAVHRTQSFSSNAVPSLERSNSEKGTHSHFGSGKNGDSGSDGFLMHSHMPPLSKNKHQPSLSRSFSYY